MAKKKKHANSEIMKGHTRTLKTGESKGTQVNNWLRKTGVLEEIEKFKPEETGDFIKDLVDKGKWLKEKQEILKIFLEIYASVGGTSANYMVLIRELEMDLLNLKKKIEDEGKNPLEDTNYQKNFKMLQQMILDANKLNLDIGKAQADYKFRKHQKGIDDDYIFTVINTD